MVESLIARLTQASLRFKWVTIGLVVLALVAGVFALTQFNQELIPKIEFPQAVVLAFNSGMESEVMRDEVTIPIEKAVADVEGVVNVESTTMNGVAFLTIQSEFGHDQEALRADIREIIARLTYPEGMEIPELFSFGFEDLPLAAMSVSSDLSTEELRELVESKIIPTLQGVPGVADLQTSGGQELPSERPLVSEPTTEPTPEPTAEPAPTDVAPTPTAVPEPVALPSLWIQMGATIGMTMETTDDVTPAIVEAISRIAPQILQQFTPEMLLALPPDVLAVLPEDYIRSLDTELRDQVVERLAAFEPEVGPGTEAGEPGSVALPALWVQAGAAQGVTMATTADLTPEMIAGIANFAPQMLQQFTPEMLLAMPLDALAALPEDYIGSLDDELQAQLTERLAAFESEGEQQSSTPTPETTRDPDMLPAVWQSAGQAQGITLEMPGDVTPEIFRGIASMAPQLLDLLTPENLRRFSPEVLAWLPTEYIETLDTDLQAELDELAQPNGGLGASATRAEAEAAALSADAPELSGVWRESPEEGATGPVSIFETAADLINNGFTDNAAQLLNMMVDGAQPRAPELVADLTPEVIAWMVENEEGFLEHLNPTVLRLLSPEVLVSLPEDFSAALDPELRAELEGIAAGTVEVFVPEDTVTFVDGSPSLRLTIFKDDEANTVAVFHAALAKLTELEDDHPGLRFDVIFEQASYIEESISGVAREGLLGAVFAVIVILIFLSGRVNGRFQPSWHSTMVTAVSIPLSLLMAYALLKWLPPIANVIVGPLESATQDIPILGALVSLVGRLFPVDYTLNIITLSGMTVAVGRVVDDTIVVLENIFRHIQNDDDRRQAVLVGTRDVAIAILASTVTTVIVFLPIGLVGGLIGEFFLPFGLTVAYALGSSFVVAVTIVPLLAFLFFRKENLPQEKETVMQRWYTPVLQFSLNHRAIALAIAGLLFVGSMYLLSQRPQSILPDFGEVQLSATVDLPNGTTMAETVDLVTKFEASLTGVEGLGTKQSEVGAAGGMEAIFAGGGGVNQSVANISIAVEDSGRIDELTGIVREKAEQVFGAEYVTVSGGSMSSGAFSGFSLVLSGDPEQLAALDADVISTLEGVDGLANVSSNLADTEMIIRVSGRPSLRYDGAVESQNTMGVTAAAKAAVAAIVPAGVTVSEGSQSEMQSQSFAQAIQAIVIAIVAVYLALIITFRSFVHPFTILFSLPMAIIGAAVALWLTDRVVGLPVLVGLMMLVGIVVTNAIVLIDRVQANRKKRGMDIHEALVEGGRTRLRPILMTATATILALTPMAISTTSGVLIAADLATVVIGGLFSSTLLTLIIVPVMYSLVEQVSNRRKKEG